MLVKKIDTDRQQGRARGGARLAIVPPDEMSSRANSRPDQKTADRQLHLLCEGWKRGLRFDGLRQLVARFYGPEVKPCELHWTEIDRLIIEIWRQSLKSD